MQSMLSILPELLILSGAPLMLFAIARANRILKLVKGQKFLHYWKTLLALMIFFVPGYLATTYMIHAKMEKFFPLLTGVVFFFGALFVCLMVHTGNLTLAAIRKSQDELEIAIQKRTGELQNEIADKKKAEVQLMETTSLLQA